eukprot:SAG31_NODE_2899_length_4933_cov_2.793795_4_plen_263_part_00
MAISFARIAVIEQIVSKFCESNHPDAVNEMMSLNDLHEIQPDGRVTSRSSGKMYWTPNAEPELTRTAGSATFGAPSAAALCVGSLDYFLMMSKPFCYEMPATILDIIAAEPTGEVAEMYRGYVRHTMMPLFWRVLDTLRDYAAYVELPPKDWLEKTFPEMSWRSFSTSVYVQFWGAYTMSFERILSEWSADNFRSANPGVLLPVGAMLRTLKWSQERAEVKQAELIGMTAEAEIDDGVFSRIESGAKASFETENVRPEPTRS